MKLKTYETLQHSKYRITLLLFLLLNVVASLFCLGMLVMHHHPVLFSPSLLAGLLSALFITGIIFTPSNQLPLLSPAAFLLGLVWAWYIQVSYLHSAIPAENYLLVNLLCLLFLGAIALNDYLLAFFLNILPPAVIVILLDKGQQLDIILFFVALPLAGFILQHLMKRRVDYFARRLMVQLHAEKERLNDLSMLDPLTGLYNRRGLQNRLEMILENHAGSHYVMLLDIDHFKAFNDNYGHAMGDQALSRVSVAIRDAVRSRDVVTRYGGEEFLVLMTNVNDVMSMQLAERIRQNIGNLAIPHRFNATVSMHVTVSAGIAPLVGDTFSQAVTWADQALYAAKKQGRNTIMRWEDLPPQSPPLTAKNR